MNPTLLSSLMGTAGAFTPPSAYGMPQQQPTPFSQSPPAGLLKRAFNFVTNAPNNGANTGPIQNLGTAANLIPSLMAGSGASQAAPSGSAAAAPVTRPPIGSFLAPGVAGASAPTGGGTVPLPQPRPAGVGAPPMNLAPPSPGPSAPAGPPPSFYNGPGSMSFGASPVVPGAPPALPPGPGGPSSLGFQAPGMPQQAPQGQGQLNYAPTGLIPRALNDFSAIKKLFAGGAGPSISGAAIY